MYRDSAHRHDEQDRAVGAIQIADGLLADCTAAAALLEGPDRPERWGAARRLQDAYGELWPHLDAARRVLAGRGANTTGYDELRGHVTTVLSAAAIEGPARDGRGKRARDLHQLDDARRAVEELRLAIPGADWRALDARARTLAGTRIGRRGTRMSVLGLIGAFALAAATWSTAIVPKRRAARAPSAMSAELAEVVAERQVRITLLEAQIGDACDRPHVLELMRLYVMDGRFPIAKAYADSYEARCGEDMAVRGWANAPQPKPRWMVEAQFPPLPKLPQLR